MTEPAAPDHHQELLQVEGKTPIPHQAAIFSALSPALVILLVIAVGILARLPSMPNPQESMLVVLALLALPALGVLAAMIALSGIPMYGTEKLLMRGLIGLALNGALFINLLLSVRMLLSGEAPAPPSL